MKKINYFRDNISIDKMGVVKVCDGSGEFRNCRIGWDFG